MFPFYPLEFFLIHLPSPIFFCFFPSSCLSLRHSLVILSFFFLLPPSFISYPSFPSSSSLLPSPSSPVPPFFTLFTVFYFLISEAAFWGIGGGVGKWRGGAGGRGKLKGHRLMENLQLCLHCIHVLYCTYYVHMHIFSSCIGHSTVLPTLMFYNLQEKIVFISICVSSCVRISRSIHCEYFKYNLLRMIRVAVSTLPSIIIVLTLPFLIFFNSLFYVFSNLVQYFYHISCSAVLYASFLFSYWTLTTDIGIVRSIN